MIINIRLILKLENIRKSNLLSFTKKLWLDLDYTGVKFIESTTSKSKSYSLTTEKDWQRLSIYFESFNSFSLYGRDRICQFVMTDGNLYIFLEQNEKSKSILINETIDKFFLDEKGLVLVNNSFFLRRDNSSYLPIDNKIQSENLSLTYDLFGFNLCWFFVIPPKGHIGRTIDPFESDDIFLNAPIYEVRRLPSGATLMRLTQDVDPTIEDVDYYNAMLNLRNYLERYIEK